MDDESIILKRCQLLLDEASNDLQLLSDSNNDQADQLNEHINIVKEMRDKEGLTTIIQTRNAAYYEEESCNEHENLPTSSYNDIFAESSHTLTNMEYDISKVSYQDILSKEELAQIYEYLNRPIEVREKWIKDDMIVVFIAAAIGSLTDFIIGSHNNKLTNSISKKLNRFHVHESGAPIDYQGAGFGGGFHRELSKGHDILRFIDGIKMFKNGQFEGIRYVNGEAVKILTEFNQYGNLYEQLPIVEAIVRYTKHMFADLFSTCSLPFPGYSFLTECNNRQIRKFTADMYQNGFNIKNVILQSFSTIAIEIIIRVYFSIWSIKQYKQDICIDENYSNWQLVKHLAKQPNSVKLDEMLLTAHSIVTAINVGKCVIKKAPWELNITEISSVVKYGFKVLLAALKRNSKNSEYNKLIRNADELHNFYKLFLNDSNYEKNLITTIKKSNMIIINHPPRNNIVSGVTYESPELIV